jgi:hypothetical protein
MSDDREFINRARAAAFARPAREQHENRRPLPNAPAPLRTPKDTQARPMPVPRVSPAMRGAADADTLARQAYAPPRDQIAELGPMAAELTGIPAAHRAGHAREAGDYGTMGAELGMSALALGGLAALRPGPGRAPLEPPTRLPVNPSREIGPNGLPIRPAQPFRQSMVGGSDDLMEAAALRPRPRR